MKKTSWFPARIKPVHAGVYETKHPGIQSRSVYQHWDGEQWGYYQPSPEAAWAFRRSRSSYQERPWRGLAQKPE